MSRQGHKPGHVIIIVLTMIVLALAIFFPAFSNSSYGARSGLFPNTIVNVSNIYGLGITPSNWTFGIWFFIYAFQVLWVLYGHINICRRGGSGKGYLYYDPPFLSPLMYMLYIINLILNIFWAFTFAQEYLAASFVSLFGAALCMTIVLLFAVSDLYKYESDLSIGDTWFNVLIVHNGMALYSTWLEVATLLGLGVVLQYVAHVDKVVSSIVPAVILAASIAIWFILDIMAFKVTCRYLFAPYIVWMVALAGIVDRNWNSNDGVQIFAAIVLAFVLLFIIMKVFVTMFRSKHRPQRFEMC